MAPWTAQLTRAVPDSPAQLALHDATRWLFTASGTGAAWQHHQALPPDSHQLLHEIPVILIPPRHSPARPEPVPALCDGITATASRLRHAMVAFASAAASSPAGSSLSWRRHALAAAITTHASQVILGGLATRVAVFGADPDLRRQARPGPGSSQEGTFRLAGYHPPVGRDLHRWRHQQSHPMATDLVLRTGRLAYRDRLWTPEFAAASRRCPSAQLAPTVADITAVMSALSITPATPSA
jgi:hypothetical protein